MTDSTASQATPSTAVPVTRPPDAPLPPDAPPDAPPAGYEILHALGEGGMGVVYRARHRGLDRPVALKYLRAELVRQPEAVARFLYEAHVTARLQHPGVPPVYEVGTLSDGRPFLAMKLIHGRNLDEALRAEGRHPTRWLAEFEAIAQAVGYAHSEGVIHRDLKPSNVMVGRFGEVQVLDWGLAKALGAAGPRDATDPLATAPADVGSAPTRAGSVLGTPAFMPPEQAVGAIDKLDARSDVFGLGGILCALLTGQPPFVGADAESTRQLAARAKLDDAFARLDACGAEPASIELAKRCLAAEQHDRPRDGGEVAAAVGEVRRQAERRAIEAERQRDRAEVEAAELRKRRRVTRLAGGLVIAALLAGVASMTFGLHRAEKAREREKTQREVAEQKQAEAEDERGKAVEARELAQRRYRLALDAFKQTVFQLQARLEKRPGTQDVRRETLAAAREGLRALVRDAEGLGEADSALVWAHLSMGDVDLLANDVRAAEREFTTGRDLARRLVEADPADVRAKRDLCSALDRLGDLALRLGRPTDAIASYRESLTIRQALAEADAKNTLARRDLSVSYNKLGDVSLVRGETAEAEGWFQKCLNVAQTRVDAEPTSGEARRDLGVCLQRMGDLALKREQTKEALAFYRHSRDAFRLVASADVGNVRAQRDLSILLNNLGETLLQLKQTPEARASLEEANAIRRKAAALDPRSVEAKRDLAISCERLGDLWLQSNDPTKARALYLESLKTNQSLADAFPNDPQSQNALGVSLNKLGDFSRGQGRFDEAVGYYQRSLVIRQAFAASNPDNLPMQERLFLAFFNLGQTERGRHEYAAAAGWFAKARATLLPWHEKKKLVGQFASAIQIADNQIASCQQAQRAIANLRLLLAQPAATIHGLLTARFRTLMRQGKTGDAIRTAECWRDWAERQKGGRDEGRYDAACAFARCAGAATEKGVLVAKAVALLSALRDAGLFAGANKAALVLKDPDFVGIRDHPTFAAFAKTLMP